jgi:hypothetical protein
MVNWLRNDDEVGRVVAFAGLSDFSQIWASPDLWGIAARNEVLNLEVQQS